MYSSPDNINFSRSLRVWNFTVVVCLIAIAVFFSYAVARASLTQPDTCFLLAFGRWIVTHGKLPDADPFLYTRGSYDEFAPGIAYYLWLSEVTFYNLYRIGGTVDR